MHEYASICVEQVKAMRGQLCNWKSTCWPNQHGISTYCQEVGFDHPVALIEDGKLCYCCCACFGQDTPIEVSPNNFVPVRDIAQNDLVLSGFQKEGGIEWQQRDIALSSGFNAQIGFDIMYYVHYLLDTDSQGVFVTRDHLFLLPSGKVKPVQYLTPRDRLARPHGAPVEVVLVVLAKYQGGVHHLAFGGFDNTTLDGHLLSAHGVVSADFAVQLAFSCNQLNPALLESSAEEPLQVGTREYLARYDSPERRAFLGDSRQWPPGLVPQ
ncbi:hypothetical protein [Paracidovorax cattleyae]|uniref:Hint domain-containing protein n=1 Tax=Paracidovorax cattleyae TaxID=80868 RepID=A0A1H0U737_9BURK|nr:hypothetical protein [Paracidovorax cattleyae]SDP61795.1 hypothetical protein SAMN04489708_11816 [Paracidovorax cattleyae]